MALLASRRLPEASEVDNQAARTMLDKFVAPPVVSDLLPEHREVLHGTDTRFDAKPFCSHVPELHSSEDPRGWTGRGRTFLDQTETVSGSVVPTLSQTRIDVVIVGQHICPHSQNYEVGERW